MWGRIYPHVVLLIFAYIFKASCQGTSSLTFVIDDTRSMRDDIDQVKSSVDKISNIVFREKSSLINNMVLVTFNDPDAKLRIATTNRHDFKRAMDAVQVHNRNNRDCPEMSMTGIYLALDKSLPGSFIYVFTDASAKDYGAVDEIKEMCQRKQSQIVFVLTGHCYSRSEPGFKVYYEIASACSGLAFYVTKREVNQVIRTIEETIRGNKTVLTSRVIPHGVPTRIPFTIDDQTEYAIISASGLYVSVKVSGPFARQEIIMQNQNGIVIKLNDIVPGQYEVFVHGLSTASIIIVGKTDFLFKHGFSELVPKTLSDTSLQPIANTNVHLSVSVTDPKRTVRINSAQILDMNENIMKILPLSKMSNDFYFTKPFVAPSHIFKVAVEGTVLTTGKSIRRIAKIPVTPQNPPKRRPIMSKPAAKIEEGTSTKVEYGGTAKLTCKVRAYPEPNIRWINSKGVTMKSLSSLVQSPYEYISYMEISNTIAYDKYTCYASNNLGHDLKSIDLVVENPFYEQAVPAGETKISYGSEGTITCNIRSKLPTYIRWYYANEYTGAHAQIVASDKYSISEDGTQLKINKMDMGLVGKYTCRASLRNNENVNKVHSTRVIVGITVPKLAEAIGDIKVTKGKPAVLECKLIDGLPKPTITWQFMGNSDSKYVFAGSDNVLRISSAEEKHAGRYKCVAENFLGKDEHVTTLIIQDLPKIITPHTKVYQNTEGDALMRIPCIATGLPKPVITWKLNGVTITLNAKYYIEDGTLLIKDPKVSDSNLYTCEARNEVGSVSETFRAYVLQNPKISGVDTMKGKIGTPVNIECKVSKGEPKPKITWQFMDKSSSKFVHMAGTDNVLHISRAEAKHAGQYKCVAQNSVSSDEHITTLIIQDLPKIISSDSKVYQAIEGDALLKIPCVTTGLPKPAITWMMNGVAITPNAKYIIEDGALIIREPIVSDTNSYTCEARNEVGAVRATFRVNVLQKTKVSGVDSMKVKIGTPANIECKIVKGEPKPKITWQFMDNSGSKFVPMAGTENVLRISSAEAKHAGQYKCVAQNSVGIDEHVTTLIIQDLPKIISSDSKVYQAIEGYALMKIPCVTTGLPKPAITWMMNGVAITPNAKYIIEDGALIIREPIVSDTNSYTCEARNEVGSVRATFRANVLQKVKVSGVDSMKVKIGTPANIKCKIVKGEPKPKITWQFMEKSGSKFVPMADTDNVLRISSAEAKHAGQYKCVAQNSVGSDEHVTTLIIEDLPKIISSDSKVYQAIEGDALIKIPCVTTGFPKPAITWNINGVAITPNTKYSIEDGVLIIKDPKVSDTNSYTCEARNEVGSVSAIFRANVLQKPEVTGVTAMKVKIGTPANIECKIVKGEPKPKVTWQFMDNSVSKFVPLAGSDSVLRIPSTEDKHTGRYKCVVENSAGRDEHTTEMTVESPPRIISNSTTVYGIEGDVALRVPCDVIGTPRPVITWKLNDTTVTPNAKYSIEDGALVIINPNALDNFGSYKCEAKNYIGSVSETFHAIVNEYIDGFDTVEHVDVLKGETKKLECKVYTSKSQSVRWFQGDYEMKTNKPYILIEHATVSNDGNYTCRVSDIHGNTHTYTYVVDVGYPPTLYDSTPVDDWRGVTSDILSNCGNDAKPLAEIQWKFNGEVLTEQNLTEIGNTIQWGHYSCNVSNAHGSVQRDFDVKSSACLINRNLEKSLDMPLLLTDKLTWPVWEMTEHYYIVKQNEKLTLSCPKHLEAPSTFAKFPKQNEITAVCGHQDTFNVDGKSYKLSDLHCSNTRYPSVIKKKVKCSTDTSELIRVGYGASKFLETYEVCFENAKKIPLYTRTIMSNTDGSPSDGSWYKYPGIDNGAGDRELKCKTSKSSCCYDKTQLVSDRDFNSDPAKMTTFIDPLNAITYWRACDNSTEKTSWEEIDEQVRSQLNIYDEFVAWSGTHTLQDIHGAVIPRYLWKVLRFDEDESVAIVHVNDPSPTAKDIKCKNVCTGTDGYWFNASGSYTYCCKLEEFLTAFDLSGTDVGESLEAAVGKMKSA